MPKTPNLNYDPTQDNLVLIYPDGSAELYKTTMAQYRFALVTFVESESRWSLWALYYSREYITEWLDETFEDFQNEPDMLAYWKRAQIIPLKLWLPGFDELVDIPEFVHGPLSRIAILEKLLIRERESQEQK
jgi:hypothetical protein